MTEEKQIETVSSENKADEEKRSASEEKAEGKQPDSFDCKICILPCKKSHKALECDRCEMWYHIDCIDMPNSVYNYFAKKGDEAAWFCQECSLDFNNKKIQSSTDQKSTAGEVEIDLKKKTSPKMLMKLLKDLNPHVLITKKENVGMANLVESW